MKKCVYCGEEIQEDAVKCRFCGEWLNKESRPEAAPLSLKFPKNWPGYVLGVVVFVLGMIRFSMGAPAGYEDSAPLIAIGALMTLIGLAGLVYWCINLYKIHKAISAMADKCYPISPARAVGFNFIPFFNLYWMFKWPAEVIGFINSRDSSVRLNRWWPGIILLVSYIGGIFIGGLWLFGSFGVLSYLIAKLKKNLEVEPLPKPYKSKSTPLSAGIVVAFSVVIAIFVIGLLAAIAIPNFVRAKGMAQVAVCRANLSAINTAKQMWAMDTGATDEAVPTWEDLVPKYLATKPVCGVGGTYNIGSVGSLPTCSIGDNKT
ncbi:MAG: hypothetical protein PHE61_08070, partial [Candidatus Omnitrophica bacterium]|nr:hypothetical protein [Candidatus Omnitrophota bacterium]